MTPVKAALVFALGAIISTSSVWAFVYFSNCDTSPLLFAVCANSPYLIPLICTFVWPLLIGLGLAIYAVGTIIPSPEE